MKFKDIKEGEFVFVKHRIKHNGKNHHFYLQRQVSKVGIFSFDVFTNNGLIDRFDKEKGQNIIRSSSYIQCFKLGHKDLFNRGYTIKGDESEEMEAFQKMVKEEVSYKNQREKKIEEINKELKNFQVSTRNTVQYFELNKFLKQIQLIKRGNKTH